MAIMQCSMLSLVLLLLPRALADQDPIRVAARFGINPTVLGNHHRPTANRPAQPAQFHLYGMRDKSKKQSDTKHRVLPPKGLQNKAQEADSNAAPWAPAPAPGPGPGPAPVPGPGPAPAKKKKTLTAKQAERQAWAAMHEAKDDLNDARFRRLDRKASRELAESYHLNAKARLAMARAEGDVDEIAESEDDVRSMKRKVARAEKEHQEARDAHREARLEYKQAKKHLEKYRPEKEDDEEEKPQPSRSLMWQAPLLAIIVIGMVYILCISDV